MRRTQIGAGWIWLFISGKDRHIWAERFADLAANLSGGATILDGNGFYRLVTNGETIKEPSSIVVVYTWHVKTALYSLNPHIEKYLQETGEESMLVVANGKGYSFQLEQETL